MNYILLAMPMFLILIIIEVVVDAIRKTGYYRINDAIVSVTAGTLSRINVVFRSLIPLAIYVYVEKHFALFDFELNAALWVFAFVLYDLCYYANHRFNHEINILWASHVVHHSSEEYNLTTALRQSSSSILAWIFYLPLAIFGIDPLILAAVASMNLLYQFWVHTRHIPKLGWYEWIFITPSNHRVHHATNDRYIDKNYGGVFIIWDRIFGTFTEELEDEPCVYGIRKPLKSWNPLWINVHFYTQLIRDAWYTKSWWDKLTLWFRPTGWRPADMVKKYPFAKFDNKTFKRFDIKIPLFNKIYSLLQHMIILVATYIYLANINELTPELQIIGGLFIILGSFSVGMLLEGRAWAKGLEYVRYIAMAVLAYQFALPEALFISMLVMTGLSLITVSFIKPVNIDF